MAQAANARQNLLNEPGVLFVGSGVIGGLSAWMWTTTPAAGGFLFGGASITVYLLVYEGLNVLGDSQLAQITRFALGVLAGIVAGQVVVSTLLGFTFTIEALQTLSIAMIITTLFLAGLCGRQQPGPAPQPVAPGGA